MAIVYGRIGESIRIEGPPPWIGIVQSDGSLLRDERATAIVTKVRDGYTSSAGYIDEATLIPRDLTVAPQAISPGLFAMVGSILFDIPSDSRMADERVKNKNLLNQIASLTAEKNHLHDQLAKFTAANVAETEPAKHDPFREFPNDPRRMGR